MTTTITVSSIHCVSTSERGHDELYIKYSTDGGRDSRYPSKGDHSIADGETWSDINLPITFKESAVVGLYDSDTLGDEFLGSYTYSPTDSQPETVPVSNTNGASYQISTVGG